MADPRSDSIDKRPRMDDVVAANADRISGIHKCCDSLPPISDDDLDALVASIRQKGLQEPIRIDRDGLLLDGRSRLTACYIAGYELQEDDIQVTDQSASAIAESNIARRHLNADQKAVLALPLLVSERKEARKRQKRGGDKGRNQRSKCLGTKVATSQSNANPPGPTNPPKRNPKAIEKIAKLRGVSRHKLRLAEKVVKADPTITEQVRLGKLSLKEAAKKVGLEQTKQHSQPMRQPLPARASKRASKNRHSNKHRYQDKFQTATIENGIYIIDTAYVMVFSHDSVKRSLLAVREDDNWLIGFNDSHDRLPCQTKKKAKQSALEQMQSAIAALRENSPVAV